MEDRTGKFSSALKRILTYEVTIESVLSFLSDTLGAAGISVEIKRVAEKNGFEEGKEIGVRETAKAMLSAGIDIEKVCEITGLHPNDLV